MRNLLLTLTLVPNLALPVGVDMCFRDIKAENEYKHKQAQEKCLATMIYGEARGEAKAGQVAVAYTALNRAVNRSVCDVILAPKQYSIFNGNAELIAVATSEDKEPDTKNKIDDESWELAQEVAKLVLDKKVADPTNGSTHYLAPKVMKIKKYKYPKWSIKYTKTVVIDGHHFYKKGPKT